MSYTNEASAPTEPGNQDYLGNQKGQYAGGVVGQAIQNETATAVLSETMQKADKLITRILQLSNRLCGVEPVNDGTGPQDASKQSDGVLPAIKDQSWEMQRRIYAAENALGRIEALL